MPIGVHFALPEVSLLAGAGGAGYGRRDFSAPGQGVVLGWPASGMTRRRLWPPSLILAADHRARGVRLTVENWASSTSAPLRGTWRCRAATGILATAQPLAELVAWSGAGCTSRPDSGPSRHQPHRPSPGSVFELDDRLVASVGPGTLRSCGWTGIEAHDPHRSLDDPITAAALDLLGPGDRAGARPCGLEALIEPLLWGTEVGSATRDSIVLAAVVAHDLGAPVLKVPVAGGAGGGTGSPRPIARVVASAGVPVSFLGGAAAEAGREPSSTSRS